MEDASYVALLWDAADTLGERDREVLDLHLRHGLAATDVAEVVGVERDAADQLVGRVRVRLENALAARVLWRGGQPSCPSLRVDLVAGDVERFDAEAVRVVGRHVAACDECTTRMQLHLPAAQMFAAVPILGMPALKARTAHGLAAAGVPMPGLPALPPVDAVGTRTSDRGDQRRRRLMVALAGAALLLIVLIAVIARGLRDDEKGIVALGATTSTTRPRATTTSRPTTTSTSSTTSSTSTTTSTVPTVVPITTPPTPAPTTPPTTTPPPKPLLVRFTLQPDQVSPGYPKTPADGPVLDWKVGGAARVQVYDDVDVFKSEKASGSTIACPDPGAGATCGAAPGEYVYTLDAFDTHGNRVLHRTLTLTIQ